MDNSQFKGRGRAEGAIPTTFDGVKYKSQTEAKWAVFFNRLGVEFTYEPRPFNITQTNKYTPDFYVKDFKAVIEVKPDDRNIVLKEAHKIAMLRLNLKAHNVWLIMGPPDATKNNIIDMSCNDRTPEHWRQRRSVTEYLTAPETHFRILEDRRNPFYYWLSGPDGMISRRIGGPRTVKPMDHDKYPSVHWNVEDAYERSERAFYTDKDPKPWIGDPDFWARRYLEQ